MIKLGADIYALCSTHFGYILKAVFECLFVCVKGGGGGGGGGEQSLEPKFWNGKIDHKLSKIGHISMLNLLSFRNIVLKSETERPV